MAAASVHATLWGRDGELVADGDDRLRSGYSAAATELLAERGLEAAGVRRVADFGCSTGLSAREAARAWAAAEEVVGVEVSPAMITGEHRARGAGCRRRGGGGGAPGGPESSRAPREPGPPRA